MESEKEDMKTLMAEQERNKTQHAFRKPLPLQVDQDSSSKDDQPCGRNCMSLFPASEEVFLAYCPGPLALGRFAKKADAALLTSLVRTFATTSTALVGFAIPQTKRCCRIGRLEPSLA